MAHFIIYGLLGWCIEILWTGLGSLLSGDVRLTAKTYLWMFPIYGSAVFFEPLIEAIAGLPFWLRGTIWMTVFFAVEYLAGWGLRYISGDVPWDYSHAALNIQGLIRLDYAPGWFLLGLVFEEVYFWLTRLGI